MANLFIPSISKLGSHRSGETSFHEGNLSQGLGKIGSNQVGEIDGEFSQNLLQLLGVSNENSSLLNTDGELLKSSAKDNILDSSLLDSSNLDIDSKINPSLNQESVLSKLKQPLEKIQNDINQLGEKIYEGITQGKLGLKRNGDQLPFSKVNNTGLLDTKEQVVLTSNRNAQINIDELINGTTKKALNKSGPDILSLRDGPEVLSNNIQNLTNNKNRIRMIKSFENNSKSDTNLVDFTRIENNLSNESSSKEFIHGVVSMEGQGNSLGQGKSSNSQISILTNGVNINDVNALDLSKISSKNSVDLVNEVTTYIEKNRLENAGEISLTVKHDEIGQFKIDVTKLKNGKNIDLALTTTTGEGREFFKLNEGSLLKVLSDKGISVSSFKLSSITDELGKNDFGSNNQSEGQGSSKHQRNFGESGQHQGRQKREQLWQTYKERLGA
jgi:hypothetical protein